MQRDLIKYEQAVEKLNKEMQIRKNNEFSQQEDNEEDR